MDSLVRKKTVAFLLLFLLLLVTAPCMADETPSLWKRALKLFWDRDSDSQKTQEIAAAKGSIDDNYIIGPSDILDIQVWKEADLSRVVPVRADGMITLPLINDIKAAGLTPAELRETLKAKITDFVSDPEISVIVKEGLSRRIYVVGKVAKPGEYLLTKEMTLLQALSLAGGFAEWADSDNVVLIRKTGNAEKRFYFNYKDVMLGRSPEQNIDLQPNDTIIVP